MAMLAVLLLLVSCSSMYSPLPDIEQGAGPDEITIAIQYLPSQRPLPLALQHAEFFLPRAGTLARAIQQLEHTGCGSGRLSALFAVVRDGILERPLTTRPVGLGPPEARHVDVDAYIGPRPQHPPGSATNLGTAFWHRAGRHHDCTSHSGYSGFIIVGCNFPLDRRRQRCFASSTPAHPPRIRDHILASLGISDSHAPANSQRHHRK